MKSEYSEEIVEFSNEMWNDCCRCAATVCCCYGIFECGECAKLQMKINQLK